MKLLHFLIFCILFAGIPTPDAGMGKVHELSQGQPFQKVITSVRKVIRHRIPIRVKLHSFFDFDSAYSDVLAITRFAPFYVKRLKCSFLEVILLPQTLPVPPPILLS